MLFRSQDEQIKIQKEQFVKQLGDTRFSSGVELLGNPNESARIGGAYYLFFLAREFPDEYLNPVCEILCSHIRTITCSEEYQKKYENIPSNEIQTIIDLLFKKQEKNNEYHKTNEEDNPPKENITIEDFIDIMLLPKKENKNEYLIFDKCRKDL